MGILGNLTRPAHSRAARGGSLCRPAGESGASPRGRRRALARATALLIAAALLPGACAPLDEESAAAFAGQPFWLGVELELPGLADGSLDFAHLAAELSSLAAEGFNTIRVNLLGAGSAALEWTDNAAPARLNPALVGSLWRLLDTASANNIGVVVSLWSWKAFEEAGYANPQRSLSFFASYRSLLDWQRFVLEPLVSELGSHPALLAWDVFDGADWVSPSRGWTSVRVPDYDMQRYVGMTAGHIRRLSRGARVGIASESFLGISGLPGTGDLFARDALYAAAEDPEGYLTWQAAAWDPSYVDATLSPFAREAAGWATPLQLLVTGLPASTFNSDSVARLQELGYRGAFLRRTPALSVFFM